MNITGRIGKPFGTLVAPCFAFRKLPYKFYNAKAKEVIGMITAAYQQAKVSGNASSATKIGDLTQYLNYVSTNTSGTLIDDINTGGSFACNSTYPCLTLHSGAVLHYEAAASFGGTNTTNANWFHIDPDGVYSGTTNGSGKAVGMFLYYNGRLTDEGNIPAGTTNSLNSYSANSSKVPSWFSW